MMILNRSIKYDCRHDADKNRILFVIYPTKAQTSDNFAIRIDSGYHESTLLNKLVNAYKFRNMVGEQNMNIFVFASIF